MFFRILKNFPLHSVENFIEVINMGIPTLRQQMLGDVNKKLNQIRAQINRDITDKVFELHDKKREEKQEG